MSRHDSKQIGDVKVMLVKGDNGSSIQSIEKTGTDGLVDTYTVTLTDGSKTTFTVTNGKAITSVAKTDTQGLVDTYTITFNDNSTITFAITNGNGITSLEKTGTQGLVDTYTITFDNGSTQTFTVTNGKDGEDGNGITSIVKTSTSGLVDTYTITFDNGSTETFDVTNGANGSDVSQSNLAPIETGNTASQSYAVGSHLIWNGIYYVVTQAIAVGGALNVGVNIQQDTMDAQISDITDFVSDEVIIGFDRISQKPIYKKCLYQSSISFTTSTGVYTGYIKSNFVSGMTKLLTFTATARNNNSEYVILPFLIPSTYVYFNPYIKNGDLKFDSKNNTDSTYFMRDLCITVTYIK